MKLTQPARIGLPIALAVLTCALAVTPAAAKTVPTHLRVLTSSGKVLADHIQHTGPTAFRASKDADCFGPDSPSSNKRHKTTSASALSSLVDAQRLRRSLRPVLITDAFLDSFGAGVCSIGGHGAPSGSFAYWYVAHDHRASSVGPAQEVGAGDDVLYYLTKGTEEGSPAELELRAPRKVGPEGPFEVTVVSYDPGTGKRVPAEGAAVGGQSTDAQGKATIDPDGRKRLKLQATRGDDVPSNRALVCVGLDCAPKGELYLGSPKRDKIKASRRADKIVPGGGRDGVKAKAGDDKINAQGGGRDRINCGSGDDVARVDRKDVVVNCERVQRA